MKKKIIYGLLFAVAMVTASSSFVSCKDYEGDDYAHWQEKNASLEDALEKQRLALNDYLLKRDYKAIEDTTALHTWLLGIQNRLGDYLLKSDYHEMDTTELHNWLVAIQKRLDEYQAIQDTTALHNWLDAIQNRLDNLNIPSAMDTTALHNWVQGINDILNGLVKVTAEDTAKWNTAAALAHENNKLILSLKDTVEHFVFMWGDDLESAYANAQKAAQIAKSYDGDTAAINRAIENAQAVADKAWNYVNQGMTVDRDGNTKTDLQAWVKYFEAADDALQEEITELNKKIDDIIGTLKKQISGVVIQGTYSPVFGYGSLPLGIQTNILAAYAGKAVQSAKFPYYTEAYTYNKKEIISADDWKFIKEKAGGLPTSIEIAKNEIIVNDAKGNAGKMYLTVNPTNIDFEGTTFKLVNSQGEESRIELSELNASDEVLSFGWTRATKVGTESTNGFYEVDATISADNALKMQPRFDKAGFKDAVKAAADGQKRMAVKEVARALFNSLQPVDRYGVKAEWTDMNGKHGVTSSFDIAPMSIDPLGFGFDVSKYIQNRKRYLPTIDKEVVANELHIDLKVDPIYVTAQDKETGKYVILVEIPEMYLDGSLIAVDDAGNASYNGWNFIHIVYNGTIYSAAERYTDVAGEIRKGYAYIDFTPMFEELFGQFNVTFENFNAAAGQINGKIDNVVNAINSYIGRANNWINRINGWIDRAYTLIDNMGYAVQPVLLWSDGTNAGELGAFVSANYKIGTVVPQNGQVTLTPTSYSLELFAPAYKKSLLVTNAYMTKDNGVMLSAQGVNDGHKLIEAVKAFNEDLKKQGQDYGYENGFALYSDTSLKKPYIFTAKPEWAGITFEIAYTAMDYEGMIAGRKFYITVAK